MASSLKQSRIGVEMILLTTVQINAKDKLNIFLNTKDCMVVTKS